jgi:hypothetical protein
MAAEHRYRYYKSIVSIPALFVGIAWVGIWLLWPGADATDWPARSLARTKFVYVGTVERPPPSRDPELIFMMSPKAREIKGPEEFPKVKEFPSGRAHFLEREDVFYPDRRDVQRLSLPTLAAGAITTYEPVWSRTEPSLMSGPQLPSIHVTMSRRLHDCGFSLPRELFDDKPSVERGWKATLHIEVGSDGKPVHVFLQSPSEYPEINDWLVRVFSWAETTGAGDTCEGWLTLEYGGR